MFFENRIPEENPAGGILLGLILARGISPKTFPVQLDDALEKRISAEVEGEAATPDAEARRVAARDMLRNGRYKPTGRGKPASEYLVRAAAKGFPRINSLVDVNNLISLEERLPISLWDIENLSADRMIFRLGGETEGYVFNPAGQILEVHDLVVGCRVIDESGSDGEPVVSPIKDSQLAKTTDGTENVGACVYAPMNVISESVLEGVCTRFADWLLQCGNNVEVTHAIVSPGSEVQL